MSLMIYAVRRRKSNKKVLKSPDFGRKEDIPGKTRDILCKLLCSLWGAYTVLVVTMRESPLVVLEPPKMVTTARYLLPEVPW